MIKMSPKFIQSFNTAMHVTAFMELVVVASVTPVSLLVGPEDAGETKSLLLPANASATEFVISLGIATVIGCILLMPAMWIMAVFCAQRKSHKKKLGCCSSVSLRSSRLRAHLHRQRIMPLR